MPTQTPKQTPAQRYYDALKRISLYSSPEWIRKHGEKEWGLPLDECLTIAYENVISEAREAVLGRRRPK